MIVEEQTEQLLFTFCLKLSARSLSSHQKKILVKD